MRTAHPRIFRQRLGSADQVALLGYQELKLYLEAADPAGSPAARLRALAARYVVFSLDHPERSRLMFRKELINRDDPRYKGVSNAAVLSFADAAAAHAGTTRATMFASGDFGLILAVWSAAHGIAHLALEDRMEALIQGDDRDGISSTIFFPAFSPRNGLRKSMRRIKIVTSGSACVEGVKFDQSGG